ncbi:hypothetical protein [Niveibacterium sp.]|uniref:hypothetical protein n=1 Tax=Niveibacterium sp. TaxID=2017444 RepID=UPI0035AF46F7
MICPADELPAAAPRLANHLLHASGGLRWHLSALRHRHGAWQPFMACLANWLAGWQPERDRLLLVGPSAGWTLPTAFPQRFREVRVLEPDPLARLTLAQRFVDSAPRFDTLDAFAPGGLATLRDHYADHAVLFCNVLGQLAPDDDSAAWCAELRATLAPLAWASWHDIASSARAPDQPGEQTIPAGSSFDALLGRFWQGGRLEVTDHGSLALAGGDAFQCVDWTLRPGQHHLVGWVSHTAEAA